MSSGLSKVDKIVLWALALIGFTLPAAAIELRTAAQDSAPKYILLANQQVGGLCIEIIKAIENVDLQISINGHQTYLPFQRLQKYLEDGRLDVFFGLKKTVARQEKFTFIEPPLYQLNYVAMVRQGDQVVIGKNADVSSLGKHGKLLTIYGTAASKYLRSQGSLVVDDSARTPEMLLKMLLANRGRFAFYHDLGLSYLIADQESENQVRILPAVFSTYYHYAAFSKKTERGYVSKVKQALETMKHKGILSQIRNKYSVVTKFEQ